MENTKILYYNLYGIYHKKLTLFNDFLSRNKYSIKIWFKIKIGSLNSKFNLLFKYSVYKFEKQIIKNREKKKQLRYLRRCNCGEILIRKKGIYNCNNCDYSTKPLKKSLKMRILIVRNTIFKWNLLIKTTIKNIRKNIRINYLFWNL